MPVENELKYVLHQSCDEKVVAREASASYRIEQAYLCKKKKLSVRIRKSTAFLDYGEMRRDAVTYKMTVKQNVNGTCIEVESQISKKDYDTLLKVAKNKLNKIRYVMEDGWEIDFFKCDQGTYFVMAEIEMPEGQEEPEQINSIVESKLLYKVKRCDNRFSSKKLANVDYTRQVLDKLMLLRIV